MVIVQIHAEANECAMINTRGTAIVLEERPAGVKKRSLALGMQLRRRSDQSKDGEYPADPKNP